MVIDILVWKNLHNVVREYGWHRPLVYIKLSDMS